MRTWDEYEIHLLKQWCSKNQVSLMERNEEETFHFDIQRNDIPLLMKDDMLYRGNWKGSKAKYQVLYPMNLFWDMIFVSIWSGLQKLSDWVNALCTLRNVVPHEGLTEFQLNQWRFTIWNHHEGEWFCFDVQKNVVGRRSEWSPDSPIQWSPLPNIQPPSLQDDSYHGFLQENKIETKTNTKVLSSVEQEPLIQESREEKQFPSVIIQEDDEEVGESLQEQTAEEKNEDEGEGEGERNEKKQWSLRDIQSWLFLGCPITKPTALRNVYSNSNTNAKTSTNAKTKIDEMKSESEVIENEETSDGSASSSSIVSQILPLINQEADSILRQKRQFLEQWWFLSRWGRVQPEFPQYTQIIST